MNWECTVRSKGSVSTLTPLRSKSLFSVKFFKQDSLCEFAMPSFPLQMPFNEVWLCFAVL